MKVLFWEKRFTCSFYDIDKVVLNHVVTAKTSLGLAWKKYETSSS